MQASRSSNVQGLAGQQYPEVLQGSQLPGMDVMQHMAHMQALLAGATSASSQVPLCSPHCQNCAPHFRICSPPDHACRSPDRQGCDRSHLALQDPNLSKMFSQGAYMEGPMGAAPLPQAEMPHASAGPAAGMQAGMLCQCKLTDDDY